MLLMSPSAKVPVGFNYVAKSSVLKACCSVKVWFGGMFNCVLDFNMIDSTLPGEDLRECIDELLYLICLSSSSSRVSFYALWHCEGEVLLM